MEVSIALKSLPRIVYGCFDGYTHELVYVGSSRCSIKKIEDNHINWLSKYGPSGRTYFRSAIKEGFITSPVFKVIKRLHCDQQEIENLEGDLIQLLRPRFNIDLDPVASSKEYKRY